MAKDLSHALGYAYIDSGAMYRAVTLYLLNQVIPIENTSAVISELEHIHIHFEHLNGRNTSFLNGENVEDAIRTMRVSEKVSPVATIPEVRWALVKLQQQMGEKKGIVMDGRDIGTVVFPHAEMKLFLTAELEVRVDRRYLEILEKGHQIERAEVRKNLEERDRIDSTRQEGPLRQADDAILLDSTHLDKAEQLAMSLALAKERIRKASL